MAAPKGHAPYAGCEKGGVPKIYTNEFIEKEADALIEWMKDDNNIYLKKFAFQRGYSWRRISEFGKANQKFADTLERAHEWQEFRFGEGGLKEEFNPGFCKFMMSNLCGFSEKSEQTHKGSINNPLAVILEHANNKTKDLIDDRGI